MQDSGNPATQDVLREAVDDLAMARDGLVNPRLGMSVPVMPRFRPYVGPSQPSAKPLVKKGG